MRNLAAVCLRFAACARTRQTTRGETLGEIRDEREAAGFIVGKRERETDPSVLTK